MADEVVRAEIIAEDKTGPGIASAKRNLSGLQRELSGGAQGFNGFRAASMSASASMSTFAAGVAGAGAVIGALGLAKLAGGIVDIGRGALQSYADFERLSMSINALAAKEALLTGQASSMQQALAMTSGKSKELLDWIQKLAIESPFRQEDVAGAFRLSMALGFSTSEAQRLTAAMLNFSTATGAGGETMERVARALGQMRTKGKVSLEEINQLTESGVDAMRILSESTGKTGKALTDSISKGLVSADDAINAIIADTERLYAGAGKASAESMSGLLSTMSEIGELSSRNLFSGMFKEAQPYIASVVGILMAPEFQAGITAWGEKIGGFTADGLQGAAEAMERVGNAITPLLNAQAPAWLTTVAGLAAFEGGTVTVTPVLPDGFNGLEVPGTVTTIDLKDDYGVTAQIAGNVTTVNLDNVTGETGKLVIDSEVGVTDFSWNFQGVGVSYTPGSGLSFKVADTVVNASVQWSDPFLSGYAAGQETRKQLEIAAKVTGEWTADALTALRFNAETNLRRVGVTGSWAANALGDLWTQLQGGFKEPVGIAGSWGSTVLSDLWSAVQGWFNARPVTVEVKTSYTGSTTPKGMEPGYNPGIDITLPPPEYQGDPRYFSTPSSPYGYYYDKYAHQAAGTDYWRGGWTWVGEKGPELLNLPRGARILSNQDSKQMIGQLAEGTTDIPGWLERGLTALGLWIPQQQARQYGPPTREEAYGTWRKIEQKGTEALQQTAKKAGDAFEDAAKNTNDAFKSALQSVPGLFGTSQVTGDQMRMAELGVPQNFADDYLRRLSDEVLNGVDWEGVDITDAANRAGIDPNLPANVILELFKNAWNDSSLFANAGNLDLINQDAVKAAIEQQQKELQGKANVLQLFGITDKNLQEQSDALGAGLASVFGKAAESDAMKAAGTQAFAAIGAGFSDNNTAVAAVGGMAKAVITATGTPENAAALEDAGKAAAFAYYGGWKSFMSEAAPPPPGGNTTPIGPAPAPAAAPGRAVGVGYWAGGWMTVHANETIYAPRGTSVQTARESAEGGRMVVNNNNYITINRAIDEEAFLARMARRLQRGY